MIGNLGGAVGPVMVGGAAQETSYKDALLRLGPFPLVSASIILGVGYYMRRRQRGQMAPAAPADAVLAGEKIAPLPDDGHLPGASTDVKRDSP